MSHRDSSGFLGVALEQIELLRAQMHSAQVDERPPPTEPDGPQMPPWMRYMMRRR
jgi:hypothetical protein